MEHSRVWILLKQLKSVLDSYHTADARAPCPGAFQSCILTRTCTVNDCKGLSIQYAFAIGNSVVELHLCHDFREFVQTIETLLFKGDRSSGNYNNTNCQGFLLLPSFDDDLKLTYRAFCINDLRVQHELDILSPSDSALIVSHNIWCWSMVKIDCGKFIEKTTHPVLLLHKIDVEALLSNHLSCSHSCDSSAND